MTVVAVVIARMGSTRLPGKVLTWLSGGHVLGWVTDAVRHSPFVDRVVVATSVLPGDDAIEEFCHAAHLPCFRGPEDDVLTRVACAVRGAFADKLADAREAIVVRVTADCPFLDPSVVAQVVRLQRQTGCAYASNVDPRTWPDGLDVECFTAEALFAAEAEATRAIDRECVTTWIARNRSRFPAEALICPLPGLARERWVLDTEDDLKFCREIARRISPGPAFWVKILEVLDQEPELRKINAHHPTNERYYEAIADEQITARTYHCSQAQLSRARKTIPLGAQTFSKSHVQFPNPSPLYLTHGQGGTCCDIDGNEYVDLVSALLPNILGYRDPDIDTAIRRQLASGISFSLATELEAQLAETLCRLIPCAEMVRFMKTGTEATMAAVRLARAHTGREKVLICGGYHGWGDWSIAGTERDLGVPKPMRALVDRIPFGELPVIWDSYAAIIVEPESNENYLRELRALSWDKGTMLIFDEVITGFRFGLGGAQEHWGVIPDLATFGKGMANGMPLAALVGRDRFMRKLEPPNPCVFISGTFGGETLSLAAAIATIAKLERDNIPEVLRGIGASLRVAVEAMIRDAGLSDFIHLRGHDALVRISMGNTLWPIFRRAMIESGTLIIASHNVCAAHTPGDIKRVLKSYQFALGKIKETLEL